MGCGAEHAGEDLLTRRRRGAVRLPPPHILRVTTAGRSACSARQFVASRVGSKRKLKMASNSVRRCWCKSANAALATAPARQQAAEPLDVVAAGDREAMGRDGAGVIAVTRRERGLQDVFHGGDKRLPGLVAQQGATAAQQVRETRLMRPPSVSTGTSASRRVAARRRSRGR